MRKILIEVSACHIISTSVPGILIEASLKLLPRLYQCFGAQH